MSTFCDFGLDAAVETGAGEGVDADLDLAGERKKRKYTITAASARARDTYSMMRRGGGRGGSVNELLLCQSPHRNVISCMSERVCPLSLVGVSSFSSRSPHVVRCCSSRYEHPYRTFVRSFVAAACVVCPYERMRERQRKKKKSKNQIQTDKSSTSYITQQPYGRGGGNTQVD